MITLQDLSKQFNGTRVVNSINLTIKRGEIVGLLGPNGAGKTTTLRMLAGVLPASNGQITIDDKSFDNDEQDIKRRIGYLPENNPLYEELTVEEHLSLWARIKGINKNDSSDAMQFVVNNTGIKDVYYRPIAELSKGYRQRVGLSQAILARPEILILDEPSEGLDPNQRRDIQSLIQELGKKRTVIISSHVLGEIGKICNRIVIIHKGKIVADDTPTNLRQSDSGTQIVEAEILGSKVIQMLKKIDGVTAVYEKTKNYYTITSNKKKDLRAEIFRIVVSHKWTLLTLMRKERELEDVFRQLTTE